MRVALRAFSFFCRLILSFRYVKHFLTDTQKYLRQMLRIINIKDEVSTTLVHVSDFSYGVEVIKDYTVAMQTLIKNDSTAVLRLRDMFDKMSSILDFAVQRIAQADSRDFESVAQYYSSLLVRYFRAVLEVVPVNMFDILNDIIQSQTNKIEEIPPKLEKGHLRNYAQLEERYKLARATHEVSVITEGILALKRTAVGVIEVNAKELLEDGIRKELVRQISMALHGILIFKTGKTADFEDKLRQLERQLSGFKRSFEYISDYVNIYGLKIWHEEFSRIVGFNVEQESNRFLKRKVEPWQSTFQNEAIPIPLFAGTDAESATWVGRLAKELMLQTDPRGRTTYIKALSGWFDSAGHEVVGIRTFHSLHRSVGTVGMAGLDRVIAFSIVKLLNSFVKFYRRDCDPVFKREVAELVERLHPTTVIPKEGLKVYEAAISKLSKLLPGFYSVLTQVGQLQLLRRAIAAELSYSGQMRSGQLALAVDALNRCTLEDLRAHYRKPDQRPYPSGENVLLPQLNKYLDACGGSFPLLKIYITTEPLSGFPAVLALFVVAQLGVLLAVTSKRVCWLRHGVGKFTYESRTGVLAFKDRKEVVDGPPFVMGVITVLKQFHSANLHKFLA